VFGGTSAGAPQWAALIAIADQGRALAGKGSLSNAQAALYSLPGSDFHDITAGSNGYSAASGYDLASGLGSPIANAVVRDLVAFGGSTNFTESALKSSTPTPRWGWWWGYGFGGYFFGFDASAGSTSAGSTSAGSGSAGSAMAVGGIATPADAGGSSILATGAGSGSGYSHSPHDLYFAAHANHANFQSPAANSSLPSFRDAGYIATSASAATAADIRHPLGKLASSSARDDLSFAAIDAYFATLGHGTAADHPMTLI
jgi:hypothetical protein